MKWSYFVKQMPELAHLRNPYHKCMFERDRQQRLKQQNGMNTKNGKPVM